LLLNGATLWLTSSEALAAAVTLVMVFRLNPKHKAGTGTVDGAGQPEPAKQVPEICVTGRDVCSTVAGTVSPTRDATGMVMDNGFRWIEPAWVARVGSTADRLEGELQRIATEATPDQAIATEAIKRARAQATRPQLKVSGRFRRTRRPGRRLGSWWSGGDVEQAWAALHTAGQALLEIEPSEVVKAQLGDMAAAVVTSLSPGDLRVKDYLATLRLLAPAKRDITAADRAQLRSIRQACDSSSDGGHADARAYRNTLILVGVLLAAALGLVAGIAVPDNDFRSMLAPTQATAGLWYVLELEVVASLAGVTGALLSLNNYSGFQSTYGLPLVQAFLKGGTGAATGLLGVVLFQSGFISSLQPQPGNGVFAVAVVFGYAQYLFTRVVDQQARAVLISASSRNDPGSRRQVQALADTPPLLTTQVEPDKAQHVY